LTANARAADDPRDVLRDLYGNSVSAGLVVSEDSDGAACVGATPSQQEIHRPTAICSCRERIAQLSGAGIDADRGRTNDLSGPFWGQYCVRSVPLSHVGMLLASSLHALVFMAEFFSAEPLPAREEL
jgi:hypothetical protein